MIVRLNIILNRTVAVDGDLRFDNLCGSHLQRQSELCHVRSCLVSVRPLNDVFPSLPGQCISVTCPRRTRSDHVNRNARAARSL